MTWALVFMMCTRWCTPQYVELYPDKASCMAKVPPKSNWLSENNISCVPIAK